MQYRRLGRSGLQLSALSYGAWVNFGRSVGRGQARELLAAAWDHGVNFFDNAEGYGHGEAERIMGDALADLRLPRDGWCVSSKVFFGSAEQPRPTQRGLSRKHVVEACHNALRRLRIEHLDLYFCHRPDPETPVGETVLAMDLLVRQGKVLYWGTSEWPAALIREATDFARANHLVAPSMEQPQYNLFVRERVEREYAPLYRDLGLGATTWSPLASGLLSGRYNRDAGNDGRLRSDEYRWLDSHTSQETGRARLAQVERFIALAGEWSCTPAQLAIAWCLGNQDVSSVILGASNVAQLQENLLALEVAQRLDEEARARIAAVFA
ncbi:aldo/keto reductase [Pseudofulvimonas gallinarii]|jgi:voltage-dependent potassium channel beta subunit|uniref:Voltage-dependent potassium channel beta subunit n=1 Tax=Pseudofulvimonas gallinarii TaxID=634155 RepID=A0A4R3LI35_9GAMM|nr:aldo/keto reductase [Pseudofulvimonas gallinarii]TCS99185.1 voltage-dependent potassium channel beta subunit [Pseudofulvimonas gallinarii]THD14008.1 aldo/keto reductase [Pseudofulvimonas gallinarii]